MDDIKRRAHHAAYMREYRRRNRDRLREAKQRADARYYERNRLELRQQARARYNANPEPARSAARAYYADNPEKIAAYRAANREKRASQARSWREANPERVRENRRIRYQTTADAARAAARAYYQAHKEEQRAKVQAWRLANPDKLYAQWMRKRLKRNPHDTVVQEIDRKAVFIRDGGICQLCGEPVSPARMTMDHKTPLTRRGAHSLENLQLAHHSCNSQKGTRTMEEWLAAHPA